MFLTILKTLFYFGEFIFKGAHENLGARGREEEGEENDSDYDGEDDDCNPDIAAGDNRHNRYKRVVDGVIEKGVE